MSYFVGIDPGLNGGICILDGDEMSPAVYVMPTVKVGTKNHIDPHALRDIIASRNVQEVVIERVGARPGQGVTSMFSFGYGAGIIEGVCAARFIPYRFVTPQAWQKKILEGLPKDGTKSSVVYCKRKFPLIDWRETPRCKNAHDGMTDAACIAMYGLLTSKGE